MADLRARFRSLDRLPAPDLWPEVERRAYGPALSPVIHIRTARHVRTFAISLLLALLLAAMLAGAAYVGGQLVRTDPDPLLDLDLVTVEVEPGVLRIDHDGVRDLSWDPEDAYGEFEVQLALGTDGSVWFARQDEVFRLGSGPTKPSGYDPDSRNPLVVSRLGDQHTLRRAGCEVLAATVEGSTTGLEWRAEGPGIRVALDLGGDVWLLAADDAARFRLSERVGDGWIIHQHPGTPIGDPCRGRSRDTGLWLTDDGVAWALWGHTLSSFDESSWMDIDVPYGPTDEDSWVDVGSDGTIWATWREVTDPRSIWWWARHDGTSWTIYRTPDQLPATRYDAMTVPHQVAPDGSLWFAVSDPPHSGECDGLARFDGTTVTRYLRGHCVAYLQVGADGTVWALAGPGDGSNYVIETYLIRPEVTMAD